MNCIDCGITIPEMPEDATIEELLCDSCFKEYEKYKEERDNDKS